MAEDASTAPLAPQDTTNFLLGQISGQVHALQNSVESSVASQAAINAANETEHQEFRKTLGVHGSQIAVLEDGKKMQQATKTERTQQWMVWLALPASVLSLGAVIYSVINK